MKQLVITKEDISRIHDLYFKVRINNVEEQDKVKKHLEAIGFYYLYDEGDPVYGFIVGNALFGGVYHKCAFDNIGHEEYTVDQVLSLE